MRTWRPRRPVVLIVDDDPDILKLLSMCLSSEGCEVHETACATDAPLSLDRVDVIVVNQRERSMSSTELVHAAQAKGYAGRVLIISSACAKAAATHADGFLAKPVGPRELLAEVERLFFLNVPLQRPPRCSRSAEIVTKA